MAWFSFGTDDLSNQLRNIQTTLNRMETRQMATNEDLQQIKANQDEALSELSGLPDEISRLVAQVESGEEVDQELLASVKSQSESLKNIVPNEPEPEA